MTEFNFSYIMNILYKDTLVNCLIVNGSILLYGLRLNTLATGRPGLSGNSGRIRS